MADSLYESDALAWAERQADLLRRLAHASHWMDEVARFLADARDAFAPSMRQRIDLPDLYADVMYRLRVSGGGQVDLRLPDTCPFVLDDLLAREPDIAALVATLGADAAG